MKTFTLHLIRHGLTQGNIDHVFVGGGTDLPLSEAGAAQIREMAASYSYPNVGVLFSSPMLRALQTADILYPLLQNRVIVEDLRENCMGVFEGRNLSEMHEDPNFTLWLDPASGFAPEGGESGRQFAERIDRGFLSMFTHMMDSSVGEAACVTHGGVIMSLLGRWALPKKPPFAWMCDNGGGYTVRSSAALLMRDRLVEAAGSVPAGYSHKNSWANDRNVPEEWK